MAQSPYIDALAKTTAHTLDDIEALDNQYVMHTFARNDLAFVSGEGMKLTATDGKVYFDFLAGIGTVGLGHSHPVIVDALARQAQELMHVSNIYHVRNRGELAHDLVALFEDEGKVFFSNSGAEANECAIKLARKWGHAHKPQANEIVTMKGSFHGRTLATVAATGQEKYSLPFAPVTPGFISVEYNNIDALEEALGENALACMMEVIQGESGVWPATQEFVARAQELCKQRNILLIVDEVQSGMFRTGKPYAYQHYGIKPDIISLAKGIGNGFPLAATIAKTNVADEFLPGDHGTTFGGNVLACTVGRSVVRELALLADSGHIDEISAYAFEKLAAIPGVTNVRGRGLMIGFSLLAHSAQEVASALLEQGFLVNAIGKENIRILPPLICEKSHIDALAKALYAIIEEKDKEN